ncbi:NAD-binding protein [Kutzneria sp. NPDC051319]|uniref:NAD-binding protein n=1 Tax=Kutzneria sp. NPDC051319 TaxID=3155047 RepID=UPI0034422AEC
MTTEEATFVVIGSTGSARRVCAGLRDRHHTVHHLDAPDDRALRTALAGPVDGVAVLSHDDLVVLRYAMAVAHIHPSVRLLASVFDRAIARELTALLPSCTVASPGDLAAGTLAGLCLEPDALAVHHNGSGALVLRRQDDGVAWQPWRHLRRWDAARGVVGGQLRPHDGATRMLFAGLVGLLVVLGADWAWQIAAEHQDPASAFFYASRVIVGVGPAVADPADPLYQVLAALAMLATIAFTALLTAGLVDRLLGPRLTGMIGRRTVPRRGHVIVVGLGQVGLRLCQELRALRIPVVVVERNRSAPNLRLARTLRIPVVLAHAEDRSVLTRLRLPHALALAAVASRDTANIAVAVTAHAVAPSVRVVLRAGDNEAIAETRYLLPLGRTCDVTRLSATYVTTWLLGRQPRTVAADDTHDLVDLGGSGFQPWTPPLAEHCPHLPEDAAVLRWVDRPGRASRAS